MTSTDRRPVYPPGPPVSGSGAVFIAIAAVLAFIIAVAVYVFAFDQQLVGQVFRLFAS